MAFTPHTENDIRVMLDCLQMKSSEELFKEIPAHLISTNLDSIPESLSEMALSRLIQARGEQNHRGLCFIGAGSYEHYIPAAVWEITSRGEFLTAYTPYQAEASQGTLQLLYEYQSMMTALTAMEVSNASLYEGASALAEAILMAARCQKKTDYTKVLSVGTLHPLYRQAVNTIIRQQGFELVELPYDPKLGTTLLPSQLGSQQDFFAIILAQPNFFGLLEPVDALTDYAHQHGALVIGCVNPISLALLKPPGEWGKTGADIVCGEGQPLGVPMASGGPYFGFMCCKQEYIRQLPGRLIGRTVDQQGKTGFALTLQAREQHIRRAKATSNICTNQGLLVTAATIYMSLMGKTGLPLVAQNCHANAVRLQAKLAQHTKVKTIFSAPFFHEILLQLPINAHEVVDKMAARGIQAGYAIEQEFPHLKNGLLVCTTETKTEADLDYYVRQLQEVLS